MSIFASDEKGFFPFADVWTEVIGGGYHYAIYADEFWRRAPGGGWERKVEHFPSLKSGADA